LQFIINTKLFIFRPLDKVGESFGSIIEWLVNPDRKRANPNGRRVNPNGKLVNPNRRRANPDERLVNPDGRRVNPNGKHANPNGRLVNPNGRYIFTSVISIQSSIPVNLPLESNFKSMSLERPISYP
jgi:hypothetical protein